MLLNIGTSCVRLQGLYNYGDILLNIETMGLNIETMGLYY